MIENANTPIDGKRLASLDGWRAVSIMLVLVQHSYPQPGWPIQWQPLGSVGGVGVRFFFVISGFLITWLMLREQEKSGTVSLKAFYVRRALRILPVYFVFVSCAALVQWSGSLDLPWPQWARSLTFTVNFGGARPPLGHLWTLGVEEQFYLLWPVIFVFCCGTRVSWLVGALCMPLVVCPILRFVGSHWEVENLVLGLILKWHSFFTICDGLAIGCLGAVFYSFSRKKVESLLCRMPLLTLLVGGLLVVIPLVFWKVPWLEALQPLQDTLQCSGFLLLLLHSVLAPRWLPYRLLNLSWVCYVGALSYSLYLWHGLFDMNPDFWPFDMHLLHGFPNWLVGVFGAGILSYHCIEQPILRKKAQLVKRFVHR